MGRILTPAYRLEMDGTTSMCWFVKGLNGKGAPTLSNLIRYVESYVSSQKPGGCNAHLPRALGHMHLPKWARLVHQRTGEVVAEWTSPAFWGFDQQDWEKAKEGAAA